MDRVRILRRVREASRAVAAFGGSRAAHRAGQGAYQGPL